MGVSVWFIFVILLIPVIFLPTIIAIKKNHPYKVAIILINIFGGLLWGIGWLVSLVWCFILPNAAEDKIIDSAQEIKNLHKLKEEGILTQDEFDNKKKSILET